MMDRLPVLSAQLAFGLEAERVGRRTTVTLRLRTPPSHLSAVDVVQVLQSIMLRNPALSYRIRFSRGTAYQEWHPTDCDFAELYAESKDAVSRRALEAIDEFATSLDGMSMVARLIRSPDSDYLLLIFDHAFVDAQSVQLIKRQMDAPSYSGSCQRTRYEAAINDRKAFETAVANGPGIKFWANRLKNTAGGPPKEKRSTPRVFPVVNFPGITIPSGFRGSLFPYILFSIHRALQDVTESRSTVIGYAWGGRNPAFSDVVGCFMNTVISQDTTGVQQSPELVGDFLDRWFSEIDHADVPFTAVTALGSSFSGSVMAHLSYAHATAPTVKVAGTQAVEIPSDYARIIPTATIMADATAHGNELQLRLLLDEQNTGYKARELANRWRYWLSKAIS